MARRPARDRGRARSRGGRVCHPEPNHLAQAALRVEPRRLPLGPRTRMVRGPRGPQIALARRSHPEHRLGHPESQSDGLWLSKTPYALRRLRLRAYSDSLDSWRLSSRCSTRFGSWSGHGLSLHLEIVALRHRLAVVNRSRPSRLRLTPVDRMLWAWFSRAWCGWRSAIHIVQPETVIAWHRRGFRLFWTWKSRHRTGRPAVSPDVRALIARWL